MQVLLGRSYILEQPKPSDLFTQRPVARLREFGLPHHATCADECQGHNSTTSLPNGLHTFGVISGCPTFPHSLRRDAMEPTIICRRGSNAKGSYTAQAAVYPEPLCGSAVDGATAIVATQEPMQLRIIESRPVNNEVPRSLDLLGWKAERLGFGRPWNSIAYPWLEWSARRLAADLCLEPCFEGKAQCEPRDDREGEGDPREQGLQWVRSLAG